MNDQEYSIRESSDGFMGDPPPEDFAPTPPKVPGKFEVKPPAGSAIPGAFLVFLMTLSSLLSWQWPERFNLFQVSRAELFRDGQVWRIFSALLGHGDFEHLFHNLPVFIFFAWILQGYFGLLASLILPILIGALSNVITVYFCDERVHLLGASGMIYGMVALWLVLYVRFDRGQWWAKKVLRAVGFSLLVLVPQTYDPTVSYLAHFSGFIIGLGLGLIFLPVFEKTAPVAKEQNVSTEVSP